MQSVMVARGRRSTESHQIGTLTELTKLLH
jgi:hypothetical protein